MEKEDEYEMVLGQNRENGLEIDKSKKKLFYIKDPTRVNSRNFTLFQLESTIL